MHSDYPTVHFLYDLDNMSYRPLTAESDALVLLRHEVRPSILRLVSKRFPQATTVEVRIYGAWSRGTSGTRLSRFLRPVLRLALNGRHDNLHITCDPADGVIGRVPQTPPYTKIGGTGCCHDTQKLVDTLIVADTIELSTYPFRGIVVCSDDTDVLPGILAGAYRRFRDSGYYDVTGIVWHRKTPFGEGKYDQLLSGIITIAT